MKPFAICGYLWLAWLSVWLIWAFQSKKTQQRESIASRFSYTIVVWIAAYLMLAGQRWQGWWNYELLPYCPWIGWAGVVLTALGFALCFWARFVLGSNWSGTVTIKVDHELIRTGPYRFVRHPIYTGMVVAMLGTALALDEWRGLVSVFLLWLGFTIKRLREEQFMRQTFGDQYTDYARTTGAIFPTFAAKGERLAGPSGPCISTNSTRRASVQTPASSLRNQNCPKTRTSARIARSAVLHTCW